METSKVSRVVLPLICLLAVISLPERSTSAHPISLTDALVLVSPKAANV